MQGAFHILIITKAPENKDNNHNVLLWAYFPLHDRSWMLISVDWSTCALLGDESCLASVLSWFLTQLLSIHSKGPEVPLKSAWVHISSNSVPTVCLLFDEVCVCNNFPRPWKLCLFKKKKKDQENCASVKNLLVLQEIFIFIYCRIYWHLLKISCVSVVMTSFMSWDAHMRCIFPVESKYLDQLVRISGACGNHAAFRLIYILCIFVRAASCFAIFPDAQRRMPFFIL